MLWMFSLWDQLGCSLTPLILLLKYWFTQICICTMFFINMPVSWITEAFLQYEQIYIVDSLGIYLVFLDFHGNDYRHNYRSQQCKSKISDTKIFLFILLLASDNLINCRFWNFENQLRQTEAPSMEKFWQGRSQVRNNSRYYFQLLVLGKKYSCWTATVLIIVLLC